jgi:hypothetical protein
MLLKKIMSVNSNDFNAERFYHVVVEKSKVNDTLKNLIHKFLKDNTSDKYEFVYDLVTRKSNAGKFNLDDTQIKLLKAKYETMLDMELHMYQNLVMKKITLPHKKNFALFREYHFYRILTKRYPELIKYKHPKSNTKFSSSHYIDVINYLKNKNNQQDTVYINGLENRVAELKNTIDKNKIAVASENKVEVASNNRYKNARPISLGKVSKAKRRPEQPSVIPFTYDTFMHAFPSLPDRVKKLLRASDNQSKQERYKALNDAFTMIREMLKRSDSDRKYKMKPYMEGLRIAILREIPKSSKYKKHKEFFNTITWEKHFKSNAFPEIKYAVKNQTTGKIYTKPYSVYQLASMYLFSVGLKPDMPGFDTAFKRTYQTLIRIHLLNNKNTALLSDIFVSGDKSKIIFPRHFAAN